jgi:type III secretory pathway component EscR|nr:MAG TPA: Surface presentation of antigens protein secretion, type III secretion.5A [Caudoviricetes sp.]
MKDFIDSLLIGSLSTYLPIWIIDNTVQRIVLAIGMSMMIYAGKLWQIERREKRK